jgi:hypothetical protein
MVLIKLWESRVYIFVVSVRERERKPMDFQVLDCGERSCFLRIVLVLFYSTSLCYYCVTIKPWFFHIQEGWVCGSKQPNLMY